MRYRNISIDNLNEGVKNRSALAISSFFFKHIHIINNALKKEVFKELRPIKGLAIVSMKNEKIFNGK